MANHSRLSHAVFVDYAPSLADRTYRKGFRAGKHRARIEVAVVTVIAWIGWQSIQTLLG